MKRFCISLALLAVTLPAVGCGSSGSSSAASAGSTATAGAVSSKAPSPGAALTRPQFIARADSICERLNKEIESSHVKSSSLSEIVRVVPAHAALEQAVADEQSKLTAPASIASQWRQVLAYRTTLADELAKLGQVAKANDTKAVQVLAASKKRVHKQLFASATRAGFKHCSQVG